MARDIFETVSVISPGRTMFDLSYEKKFTCDMGQLIPILCEEAVPGDRWKIGMEALVRLNPQIFPLMHGVNVYVHYFFVPSRVLWDEWEEFITGGEDGESANVLPRWVPAGAEHAVGSLWDYLGYPTEVTPAGLSAPIDFGKRAYNAVWNAYYRDETHQAEVAITDSNILYRNWKKDYFTACLPWQQRGIAPAMPVSGITHAVWDPSIIQSGAGDSPLAGGTGVDGVLYVTAGGTAGRDHVRTFFNDNTVDLSAATTFNIADLRLAVQYQVWLERNARCGVRYTEFLHGHFGVSPRDDRLQRPEYIGGVKAPVIVSEVLQTSRSDTGETPLGTMGGHGISGARQMAGTYRVEEFGYIIGIMSVMPDPAYQQGFDRQWLRRTKLDFYFPEFAHLSEQAVEKEEVYAVDDEATNRGTFGYIGRYDEYRVKRNMTCGLMRTDLKAWGLTRIFASAPSLNSAFISSSDIRKDIFAVPSEPGLIVNFGNIVHALRPLPFQSEPGLMGNS